MNDFNKFIVFENEAEVQAFAVDKLAPDPWLPSIGKHMSDIYGKKKTYNTHYRYSLKDYEDGRITNPDHVDFGKIAVRVSEVDVTAEAPELVGRLVDEDPTWKV